MQSPPILTPPTMDDDDDGGGGHLFRFSPVLVGLLGVIAGAIVVATYHLVYTICTCYRRPTVETDNTTIQDVVDQNPRERPRQRNRGASTIPTLIPIFRYSKDCNEDTCAICLGDFKDGEQIRVLPDCLHFFHVGCIDKWLNLHSNCPLCRAGTSPPQQVAVSLPESSISISTGLGRLPDLRV
ncbi:RING-H2 finger protein ATL39-like [Gossypium arboreum]|uniref:RING-type E3 ubiquitin transferase n=1 Tax=Gossypium arboreum TaxID=29729 RepID=A0ABR0NSI7_GOSAR|nr:RING-H2 finger protein ATL39-like [Gossypium arboreum]KAK5804283.1 hypothetical protein PVK06_031932 [Gossypium arboreum]